MRALAAWLDQSRTLPQAEGRNPQAGAAGPAPVPGWAGMSAGPARAPRWLRLRAYSVAQQAARPGARRVLARPCRGGAAGGGSQRGPCIVCLAPGSDRRSRPAPRLGERARRLTTCEALDSWPPRVFGAGSRGEVMRSKRRPGEAPGHFRLVARQRALSSVFITGRRSIVNPGSLQRFHGSDKFQAIRHCGLTRCSSGTPSHARPRCAGTRTGRAGAPAESEAPLWVRSIAAAPRCRESIAPPVALAPVGRKCRREREALGEPRFAEEAVRDSRGEAPAPEAAERSAMDYWP